MAPQKLPLWADEELGKKDDDHRPLSTRFEPRRQWKKPRPRRILLTLVAVGALWLFFKYMPTDLAPAAERYSPDLARLRQQNHVPLRDAAKVPAIPKAEPSQQNQEIDINPGDGYDGEVQFYQLAKSLPRHKYPEKEKMASSAVVFAASSLPCVSDLLSLACRMAGKRVNSVHFVLMGKDEVSIEGIKEVNRIADSECPMTWHDSRPDFAPQSTESRMQRSVLGGLEFIHAYLRPAVIITQGKHWEDPFFWNGVMDYCTESGIAHIGLSTASTNLMWMASLDSSALQVWNDIHIEMVVHAPTESSGTLIRLIRSLDAADYLGSTPSLTIELPPRVDSQLFDFLERTKRLSKLTGRITLRRRIPRHQMDEAESSLWTVESFYPRDPKVTHMLLLSPQAELAPSFYHYLKYSILHYKQSARANQLSSKLLGISLELPSSTPTADAERFNPPSAPIMNELGREEELLPSFLWQAPNSNAALYFGDKWAEFHTFLSNRLEVAEIQPAAAAQTKLVSKRYPAFMEHLLELIHAKGYYMVYPSFPGLRASSLATVHNELYQPPEEFVHDSSTRTVQNIDDPKQPLKALTLGSVEKPLNRKSTIMPLLDQFSVDLPPLESLPLLSYDGEILTPSTFLQHTEDYATKFRVKYGGCSEDATSDEPPGDLFCLGG
ncbi:hypothetical protein N7510_004402 [Penicillium lagena]|uniref:uncharacterized protein n=1 Tax=Penicillium lagena TaxID=94218 RepID=UPI0025420C43|nr:uncharacterized protein N7510_004402 [Penicillium lagena]KAJ5620418.1 hypothetical protein N7510_004402 [Penicillium lagena]